MPATTASRRDRMQAAADGGSPRARTAALAAICLGFFVIQLDVTIVNVALPTIQHEIGGTVAGLQWVVDGYTLALASVMLTAGSMADRSGARRVYLIGLAGFAAGSAACALAPGLGVLIAARAVQGLGASALLPCSLALIVHRFPDRGARARALGVWGAMGSLGVALGPVLGGVLIALAGWRAIFLVNVPVCVLTGWLLVRYVPESPPDPARRVDLPGLLLGVAALAALTAGFIEAGQQGWLAPLPAVLGAAAIAATLFFLMAERRQASPMLPAGPVPEPGIQRGHRRGPAVQPVPLRVPALHLAVPAAVAARVRRRDRAAHLADERGRRGRFVRQRPADGPLRPRLPMIAGLALAAAGAAVIATVSAASPLGVLLAGSVILGLCSLAMPAMTSVVVGAAGTRHAGVASGVLNAARQAGGALGVALLGSLLTGTGHGQHGLAMQVPLSWRRPACSPRWAWPGRRPALAV